MRVVERVAYVAESLRDSGLSLFPANIELHPCAVS